MAQESPSWCINLVDCPASLSYSFTTSIPLYIFHYFHEALDCSILVHFTEFNGGNFIVRYGGIHAFRLLTNTHMHSLGLHLGSTVLRGLPPLSAQVPLLARNEGVLVEMLPGMQECRNSGVAT